MPWSVGRSAKCPAARPWAVTGPDGEIAGCHPSKERAQAQQRALYARGASAEGDTMADMAGVGEVYVKVRPDLSAFGEFGQSLVELAQSSAATMSAVANGGLTEKEIEAGTQGVMELEIAANGDGPTPAGAPMWEGILGVEGKPTSDRRYLIPGEIAERELPLTLMAQFSSEDGHRGAEIAARIDEIWRVPNSELGEGAIEIWGRGPFDTGEHGKEAARLVEERFLRGVSLDLAVSDVVLLDPETLEEIDTENAELDLMGVLMGKHLTGIKGTIMGATLCAHPALEDASVRIVDGEALLSSAFGMSVMRQALTASAAGLAPLRPPKAWFEMPELDQPTPLTVTEEGQVYGHLALWGQCHTGFASCETPPHSPSNYSFFHLGEIETEEGEKVSVGRITVGKPGVAKGGHASIVLGTRGALEHYDHAGCGAAFVRAVDGKHGIWLAGAIRSDLPAERIRDLRAYPPSGDWRPERGGLELCAVLAVPVPGYPVPRTEMRLVASGATEEVVALVATGYAPGGDGMTREEQRRLAVLTTHGQEALQAKETTFTVTAHLTADEMLVFETEVGLFQDIDAATRRRYAKQGIARPDGSFPIPDCSYAEKAIRAQGRAKPSDREAVRRHISKRVRALRCSGTIFEKYR